MRIGDRTDQAVAGIEDRATLVAGGFGLDVVPLLGAEWLTGTMCVPSGSPVPRGRPRGESVEGVVGRVGGEALQAHLPVFPVDLCGVRIDDCAVSMETAYKGAHEPRTLVATAVVTEKGARTAVSDDQ
jgi:hypothetical protein